MTISRFFREIKYLLRIEKRPPFPLAPEIVMKLLRDNSEAIAINIAKNNQLLQIMKDRITT